MKKAAKNSTSVISHQIKEEEEREKKVYGDEIRYVQSPLLKKCCKPLVAQGNGQV